MEGRKKKPLSDITNTYNLIPTSTLRKLISASSNSNSILKPSSSILKSNASSVNQRVGSESSNRSDASIGSSSVGAARNSRMVQFRTPPQSTSSATSHGGVGGKDVSNNQRKTIEKSKKEREAAIGSTSFEKRKDKGKGIAVQFRQSPSTKMKDNQNQIQNPCIPLEGGKLKDNRNLSLFDSLVENEKEPDNENLITYSSSYGKTSKMKGIRNSSGFSLGSQEKLRNGIADHSSSSTEKVYNGKKEVPMSFSSSSTLKTKETGKESVNPSSFSLERTKEKVKPLNPLSLVDEKTREKEKSILQPSNIVQITNDEGSSVAVAAKNPHPWRKSQKRKNDVGASSSCPPVLRTKNIKIDLDEAEGMKSSKSRTEPHSKCRKKRGSQDESTSELPLDFIEQQRVYFKEVDDFELPVEEVSEDELD